jgi:nicotinate-nucleotide adenylyltransferase
MKKGSAVLIGGSFNPPHFGHTKLAESLLKTFELIFLMPCYKHMYGKKMASAKHRLAMCRIAVKDNDRIKVLDYEIKHRITGGTYQLVKQLLKEKFTKNYSLSLAIGGDNAETFDKWFKCEELKKLIPFVVVPRVGVPLTLGAWYTKSPHFVLTPGVPIPCISSTNIRKAIQVFDVIPHLAKAFLTMQLDPKVLEYITKHKLYKNGC